MPTSYTPLLGLAQPQTGELTGTWGDVVNQSITALVEQAIAGATTISTDADVVLTTSAGASNQARSMMLILTGARTAARALTAPAQSKLYIVANRTTGGFDTTLRGAGPTTGVAIPAGITSIVVWNGADFVLAGTIADGSVTLAKLSSEVQGLVNGALQKAGGTMTGAVFENRVALGTGSAIAVFTKTITAATTFTVTGTPAAGAVASFVLDLTNGGAFAVTWWSGVKWAAGITPTLTVSGRDALGFFTHDGGTTWTGILLSRDVK